jgi:hypothetical protein
MEMPHRLYNVYYLHNGIYNCESLLEYSNFLGTASSTDAKKLQKIPEGATHIRVGGRKQYESRYMNSLLEFDTPEIVMYSEERKILKKYLYKGINYYTKSIKIPETCRYINITEKDYRSKIQYKGLTWTKEKRPFPFPFTSPPLFNSSPSFLK